MASEDFSCIARHRGPPPKVSPLPGKLNCRALLQCLSRAWECQELPPHPALSTLFFLPTRRSHGPGLPCQALARIGSEVLGMTVPCSVPCHPTLHGGCLSSGLKSPEHFSVPLDPGGGASDSSWGPLRLRRAGHLLAPGREEVASRIRFQACGPSSLADGSRPL